MLSSTSPSNREVLRTYIHIDGDALHILSQADATYIGFHLAPPTETIEWWLTEALTMAIVVTSQLCARLGKRLFKYP
jgi:hypothetical protein